MIERELINLSKKIITFLFILVAVLGASLPATGMSAAADYTYGVDISGTTVTFWLHSDVQSAWTDVHYNLDGGGQQDFRMTFNSSANRFEKAIAATSGNTINYYFTYENNNLAYDTPHFTYALNLGQGGNGGGTDNGGNSGDNPGNGGTPGGDQGSGSNYTYGIELNAATATLWFHSAVNSSWADVHYTMDNGVQQNLRMSYDSASSRFQQTIAAASGDVLSYYFTYENNSLAYDTEHYTYTLGRGQAPDGGGQGGSGSNDGGSPTGSDPNAVAAPNLLPAAGIYTSAQTVTMTTPTAGAAIYYTTDGSTPTPSSALYTHPLSVTADQLIKAIAVTTDETGSATASEVTTEKYKMIAGGLSSSNFPLLFQNNTRGNWADNQIYITVLGVNNLTADRNQWSYLKPDGSFVRINHLDENAPGHWTKNGRNYANLSLTLDQAPTVYSPDYIGGGRIYISIGSPLYFSISPDDKGIGLPDLNNTNDPNYNVVFDWYEYTYSYHEFAYGGNTTQVDQFGFPMTARLQQTASGYDKSSGITLTRDQVFSQYNSSVAEPFRALANSYRILAPRTSPLFRTGGENGNYLASYIDQTWNYFTNHPFVLNRNGATFAGNVVDGNLQFTKDGHGPQREEYDQSLTPPAPAANTLCYTGDPSCGPTHVSDNPAGPSDHPLPAFYSIHKPTSEDVMACSGNLTQHMDRPQGEQTMMPEEGELGAELCAAFTRGIALKDTSKWWGSDITDYYTNPLENDFAEFFHQIGIDNRAYGFAYDDVNDQSSVRILPNSEPPTSLTIGIGW